MKTKLIICFTFLWLTVQPVFAQKLTFGIENGINYSNLRKKFDYDRFASRPGPVNGLVVKYGLGSRLVLQSGVNHTSYYFEEHRYLYYDYMSAPSSSYIPGLSSSIIAPPGSFYQESTKYSFLRIPMLVKFRTPGRVNFEVGAGAYYAILTNDEYRGKDRDKYTEEYRDENFPKMNDWGWILASSVTYNINDKWCVFASGQLTYGHEKYIENAEGKMGSSEISAGIGYKPFGARQTPDTTGQKISVLPHAGINISQAGSSENKSHYKSSVGFSTGVSLMFLTDNAVSFVTGTWYERKGYNLSYAGHESAIYNPSSGPLRTYVVSDVQLDYFTIPLLMDISFGRKIVSQINFGIYFSLLQNGFAEGERTNTYDYGQGYEIRKEYFNESLDLMFKTTDFGFMAGYRINIPLFKWASAFVSVNQSLGVKNILNDSEEAQSEYSFIGSQKIRNRSTAVHFGLSIPVNKNQKP